MSELNSAALRELLSCLERLFESGDNSDLVIRSSKRNYNVHRIIICYRSRFFETACFKGFREQTSGVVDLLEECPMAVDCMINYFYKLDYDDDQTPEWSHSDEITEDAVFPSKEDVVLPREVEAVLPSEEDVALATDENVVPPVEMDRSRVISMISLDARVYSLGDKFYIAGLKDVACRKFERGLKQVDVEKDLIPIIAEIYGSTPAQDRGLRDLILGKIYEEIQYWVMDGEFMDAASGIHGFYGDLLQHTVKRDLEKFDQALSAIQHQGYCARCSDELVLRKTISRRRNVQIEKYCAKCGYGR